MALASVGHPSVTAVAQVLLQLTARLFSPVGQATITRVNEGRFTNVVAKWPGSTHDSFVWANCGLCQFAEVGGFGGCWLLGDSGYPLRPFLLTSIRQTNTPAEVQFNMAHGRSRAVVERAIGFWKKCFRCLSKTARGLQLHSTK